MSPSVVPELSLTAGRPKKRARVKGGASAEYDALQQLRDGETCADALGATEVSLALKDLIASHRVADGIRGAAEEALRTLHSALGAKEAFECCEVSAGDGLVEKVLGEVAGNYLRAPRKSFFKGKNRKGIAISWGPPEDIVVVGSFLLGLATNPLTVDVGLQMPSNTFKSKDYINFRYHDKRLLYLVYLVHVLRSKFSHLFTDFAVGRHVLAEDFDKPLASFRVKAEPSITIRLVPLICCDQFDWTKLSADRGNVRPVGASSITEKPTPVYNSSVKLDSVLVRHMTSLHKFVSTVPAFTDAALLLRMWIVRRRLCGAPGFVAAALLAHTVSAGAAPKRASKEHLFRAALGIVSRCRMDKVSLNGLSVTNNWDDGRLYRWREEARAALASLDAPGSGIDAWGGVLPFLFCCARGSVCRPVPFCTIFDGLVSLKWNFCCEAPISDDAIPQLDLVRRIIRESLVSTNRVRHLEQIDSHLFGLTFYNPGASQDPFRKVDTRPGDIPATEFCEFWGSKVETRRFKDGRIVESLVWSGGPTVLHEILQYSFNRHFGEVVTVNVAVAQIESTARMRVVDHGCSRAIAVFNELSTILRKVEGLPLSVAAVHGVAPHLRRSGVLPVRPNPNGKFIEPLEIVASFESSGAWPDDILAIASAKAAFYVALKSGLAALGVSSQPTISFIDILMGGFVFRLRIRVDKEDSLPDLEDQAREVLGWETHSRLSLHECVRNVRSPIYGDTVRLFKRWLSTHMLYCEMGDRRDMLIDLFVSRLFFSCHEIVPRSCFRGFCQCLHLLAEFPWEATPFVIPAGSLRDEDLTVDSDAQHVRDEFEAFTAKVYEAYESFGNVAERAAWFATKADVSGSLFRGAHGPENAIWKRAMSAASAALKLIDELSTKNPDFPPSCWETLFSTPVSCYNYCITAQQAMTPRRIPLTSGILCASAPVTRLDLSLVGFDPLEKYVHELKNALGNFALFLYDVFGGDKIYIVWRPSARTRSSFSVRALPFMKPACSTAEVEPNWQEMLSCICRLGGNLVKSVENCSSR